MITFQPITLYEALSLVVSFAGFTAVIISIIFLMRQTKAMTTQTAYLANTLKSNSYQNLANNVISVDEIFVVHPELRPYFYSGKNISEEDALYSQAIAVAELILDCFDSILIQMRYFPGVLPTKWWEVFIVDSFVNSPILCQYFSSVEKWYIDELKQLRRQAQQPPEQRELLAALLGNTATVTREKAAA